MGTSVVPGLATLLQHDFTMRACVSLRKGNSPAVYHGYVTITVYQSEYSIAIRRAMCREGPGNSEELNF